MNLNIYTTAFACNCPTNGVRNNYTLRIEATEVISVEQIVAVIESIESGEPVFHEEIAGQLAARFPGRHTLKAHHHGVDIETQRDGVKAE